MRQHRRSVGLVLLAVLLAFAGLVQPADAQTPTPPAPPTPAIQGAAIPAGTSTTYAGVAIVNRLPGDVTFALAEQVVHITARSGTPPFMVASATGVACELTPPDGATGARCLAPPGTTLILVEAARIPPTITAVLALPGAARPCVPTSETTYGPIPTGATSVLFRGGGFQPQERVKLGYLARSVTAARLPPLPREALPIVDAIADGAGRFACVAALDFPSEGAPYYVQIGAFSPSTEAFAGTDQLPVAILAIPTLPRVGTGGLASLDDPRPGAPLVMAILGGLGVVMGYIWRRRQRAAEPAASPRRGIVDHRFGGVGAASGHETCVRVMRRALGLLLLTLTLSCSRERDEPTSAPAAAPVSSRAPSPSASTAQPTPRALMTISIWVYDGSPSSATWCSELLPDMVPATALGTVPAHTATCAVDKPTYYRLRMIPDASGVLALQGAIILIISNEQLPHAPSRPPTTSGPPPPWPPPSTGEPLCADVLSYLVPVSDDPDSVRSGDICEAEPLVRGHTHNPPIRIWVRIATDYRNISLSADVHCWDLAAYMGGFSDVESFSVPCILN